MTTQPYAGDGARAIAAEVLARIEKQGAFAAAALDAALASRPQLDARDRALATTLVYGVTRTAPWLEARLTQLAPRGLGTLDGVTRAHLLVAAFQLTLLERVPPFAAVSEAVGHVRALRGPRLAGFVNAVLRRLAADPERQATAPADAALASVPPDLRAALEAALGPAGAASLLSIEAGVPPIGLRVRLGADRDQAIARLREAMPSASFEPGRASPLAILVRGAGDPHRLPGWADGELAIQEEGSQVVALALGARLADRVLDACAGRGNKTSLLAEQVGPTGAVDAADVHPSKLERLVFELGRQHLVPRATYAVDWSIGPGGVPEGFDRVLVDAPCSGTGTLRRRPDLARRRTSWDMTELATLQSRILVNAASRLRPGGALVYAVCSVLREEGEGVTERAAAEAGLVPAPFAGEAARALAGESPTLRLLPDLHGTDGYFLASFVRAR